MTNKQKENNVSFPRDEYSLDDLDYDAILKGVMNSVTKGLNLDVAQDKALAVAQMAQALKAGRKHIEQLALLIKVSALVNSTLHIDEKLEYILESASQVLDAEAGSILLKDEDRNRLVFKAATGEKAPHVKLFSLEIDEGIAGWVASRGEPLIVPDVAKDPRYSPRIANALGFPTRSIVCVPLVASNKVIGAHEAINRHDGKPFDHHDLGLLSAFSNQAAISLENSLLYRQSTIDDLTGLYNQRYFKEQLRIELNRAQRYDHSISLLMIDLDNFKKYNDNYGHPRGDQLLHEVARIIKTEVRESDSTFRYGGEEITILLTETTLDIARQTAERIRAAVARTSELKNLKGKGITCSIGISDFPQSAADHVQLLDRADRAMYAAKAKGKNTVVAFGEIR